MRSSVIALLSLVVLAAAVPAAVVEVPGDLGSIQDAINASSDGDIVLVAPGTYYENIRFYGKRIVVTSTLDGDRALSSAEETVIDGSYPTEPDSAATVYFVDSEDSTSVLRGFTITHAASKTGDGRATGEGIVCDRASPMIEGNIIVGNSPSGVRFRDGAGRRLKLVGNEIRWNASTTYGGGIHIEPSYGAQGGNALIEGNIISGNTAQYGGALAVHFGQSNRIVVRGNAITSNAGSYAAGLWSDKGNTDLVLERNVIAGNAGVALFVGDYAPGSHVLLVNNTICDNEEGLVLEHCLEAQLENNIVTGSGSGVTMGAVGSYSLTYNDVWGNDGSGYVGCVPGEGSISEDPSFVDGVPFDYHLKSGSPCIDAADPASPPDPDGTRCDMGAFPFDQVAGVASRPVEELALTAWPNPFTGGTRVSLELVEPSQGIEFLIHDVAGRLVTRLLYGAAGPGRIEVAWKGRSDDGLEAAPGVYFLSVSAGAAKAHARLVKLR